MPRVLIAIGTRPEAIKMAPVYHALAASGDVDVRVLATGQHRQQLDHALSLFKMPVHADLALMRDRQELADLAAALLQSTTAALRRERPDYVLVHGDTLTTFACAWAAFLERIPVGHVEAGLRSFDLAQPFPEEANRVLTDAIADLALAPTPRAAANLARQGFAGDRVVVTGQTGIDAVLEAARKGVAPAAAPDGPLVVVTLHRRESWAVLDRLAAAIAAVARAHPDRRFVFPIHLNPVVQDAVKPAFAGVENVTLLDALPYGEMAALLPRADFIITDSGGLQEEGAALHVPVAVVRDVTERPEGAEAGTLVVVGTDPAVVQQRLTALLGDSARLAEMRAAANPFGDGAAGARVAQAVRWRLGLDKRPADWVPSDQRSD